MDEPRDGLEPTADDYFSLHVSLRNFMDAVDQFARITGNSGWADHRMLIEGVARVDACAVRVRDAMLEGGQREWFEREGLLRIPDVPEWDEGDEGAVDEDEREFYVRYVEHEADFLAEEALDAGFFTCPETSEALLLIREALRSMHGHESRIKHLIAVKRETDAVFAEVQRRELESAGFNALCLVETYDDVFWLAERVLSLQDRPLSAREHSCDRALLASFIALIFDVHELFAHPERKTDPRYPSVRETQFSFLGWVAKLELPVLNHMLDSIMRRNMWWDDDTCSYYEKDGCAAKPNCMCVIQWLQFSQYREVERKRSHRRCALLIEDICERRYGELLDDLVRVRVDEELLSMSA